MKSIILTSEKKKTKSVSVLKPIYKKKQKHHLYYYFRIYLSLLLSTLEMGTSLSTEFDWVYDPAESRWRLGLPPSVGSAAAAYQQQHPDLDKDETDDPDQNNDDNENTQRNNNNIRHHRNEKSSSFSIQHSQRNEKAISMLYFSLVQAFCSACGSPLDKSAIST